MRLRHKHPRYYVDLVLFFPTLICVVSVFVFITDRSQMGASELGWWLAGLGACVLLTKERLVMVAALLGYVAAVSAIHIPLTRDATLKEGLLVIAIVSGAGLWGVIRFTLRLKRESYREPPTKLDWAMSFAAVGVVVSMLTLIALKTGDWYAKNWRTFR